MTSVAAFSQYKNIGSIEEALRIVKMTRRKTISGILIASLLLLAAISPIEVSAAVSNGGISIDETNFPDSMIREVVQGYDGNGDGVLSSEEADSITDLSFASNPTTFKGIEYLPSLERISCNDGTGERKITELDVSHNPELKYLNCSNTAITSLDVSKNPKLESLDCTDTYISNLDTSNNPMLKELRCGWTNLTSLNLSHNPELEFLECGHTNLSSLDITRNPKLYYVGCFYTKISNLDTSNNQALQSLDCYNSDMTSLDMRNNPLLWHLDCNNTRLTEINVSKNPALSTLCCQNTNLTSLDFTANTNLTSLQATGCPLLSLLVSENFKGSVLADSLKPYKLVLQQNQDSIDLKTLSPTIAGGKIYNLTGCEKQGTVLSGLKDGQTVTYCYDYNGGSINVVIEVSKKASVDTPVIEQPESSVQKPVISSGEGYTTSLNKEGTIVTIAVKTGYQLEDVKVNGVSWGKATTVAGLKTGDVVNITVSKEEQPVFDLSDAVVTIPFKSYTYTGKAIKPMPEVFFEGQTLEMGTDYTVAYSKNTKIGQAVIVVTGKGAYSGVTTLSFKIIPKKVSISSAKSLAKKSVTVRWKKVSQAAGYQVQWCRSSKFSTVKSAKVKGASNTVKKIKKLSSKKKYYVRVRAYKVVDGTTYYGKWSAVKKVTVK